MKSAARGDVARLLTDSAVARASLAGDLRFRRLKARGWRCRLKMNKSTHFHAKGQSHCESIAERDKVAHPATLLAPRTGFASQRETRASRIGRHETNPHSLRVKSETPNRL